MSKPLRFFIAGIIQGSLPDTSHPQDYRREIAGMLEGVFPGCAVFDPVQEYPDSLEFDDAKASNAFFDLMDKAGKTDVLLAFVPEASMGTAIELWNAFHAKSVVVTVSPLRLNWVVRYLSDKVVENMDELRAFIESGGLRSLVEAKLGRSCD